MVKTILKRKKGKLEMKALLGASFTRKIIG